MNWDTLSSIFTSTPPWAWETLKLLTAGLVGGIGGQLVQWLRETHKETRLTTLQATYLAVRLAALLEAYAVACADAVDQSRRHRHNREVGQRIKEWPKLGDYQTDGDWKSLRPALLSKVVEFPNELVAGARAMRNFYDFGEPEDAPQAWEGEIGKIGYRASQIARELRSTYSVPRNPVVDWDYEQALLDAHRRNE